MVPQDIGLLVEINAAGQPLLNKERLADLLEQGGARAAWQPAFCQPLGDRFDPLERPGDAPFVEGEGHADRYRLGDEQ
jgi:hypothetical protein